MYRRRADLPGGALKAVLFDFDGVILESADIKTEAFRALFAVRRKHLARIMRYHLANAGISRFRKFDHIYKGILKEPLGAAEREDLGQRFSKLVYRKVMTCPFVPGAREFLGKRHKELKFFVVSGTPQPELRRIVRGRGLSPFFKGVFGSPQKKGDLAKMILKRWKVRPQEAVFIGDAQADREAASSAGTGFFGRVPAGRRSPFPRSTKTLKDLRALDRELSRGR